MNITAIIVTYNGMKWYKNCFDSLRTSTIPIQTVVIDNNSTDETIPFIKKNYPEIHLIESKINLGFGKANNIGFKYAVEQNADYVFLLNQDAWIKPNTIEALVDIQTRHPEYGILSPIHLNGKEDKIDLYVQSYIQSSLCPNLISDYIVKGKAKNEVYPIAFINAALWLISKECFLNIGGFAPIFPHYGEDNNYIHRAHFHGYKVGICPTIKAIHDRDFSFSTPPFKKLIVREFIKILIPLMDIQHPLHILLYKNYLNLALSTLRNIFSLKARSAIIDITNSFKIFLYLPKIRVQRNLSKMKGLTFISQ